MTSEQFEILTGYLQWLMVFTAMSMVGLFVLIGVVLTKKS